MKDIEDIEGIEFTPGIEDTEEPASVEEFRQIRREILMEYDNDWDKYMDALMAEPRIPGVKYIDPPPMSPGIKSFLEDYRRCLAADKAKKVKSASESKNTPS